MVGLVLQIVSLGIENMQEIGLAKFISSLEFLY